MGSVFFALGDGQALVLRQNVELGYLLFASCAVNRQRYRLAADALRARDTAFLLNC